MKLFLPVLLLGAAVGAAASATTLSFSHTIMPQPTPFTTAFTLNSFDAALGTLTGVEIIVDDTAIVSVEIFNTTSSPQPFTNASAVVPLSVTGPGGVTLNSSVTAGPLSGTAKSFESSFTGLYASNVVVQAIAPGAFSNFEGSGTQNLQFNVSSGNGTFSGTGGNGIFFGGSAQSGGTIDVDYTYTTFPGLPEPANWALMIVGFGVTGGILRRRRSEISASI